ncbi:MAG: proline--tRNA ligase, partial [Solirubrobacterales bacterium]|nr:proline--tRNA ligase [Solirubrobacterales bacterium]
REFIMKDAYTFDRDMEGLDAHYEDYRKAYHRVFERCGLDFYECASDVGMMGGTGAHEFMAPCAAGENDVALGADGYAANVEVATADPQPVPPLQLDGRLETPTQTTIEAVAGHLGIHPGNTLKAFPVVTESRGLVMVFVRGDHRINDVKLRNHLREDFRPAREEELPGPAGFLGPSAEVQAIVDPAVGEGPWVAGANEAGWHEVVRELPGERADIRTVEAGDLRGGSPIRVGLLALRAAAPLGATYLDEHGKEQLIVMGSYGIGPARIAASAVEQYADDRGIAWPKAIAPFDVEVVALGKPGSQEAAAAEVLYKDLRTAGLDALLDDRSGGAGEKLTDAELLGAPLRLVVGKRSAESGAAEAQLRRGRQDVEGGVPLREAAERVRELWPTIA